MDKAKRILWPVKQKYGKKLSLADLILLAGNAGMEDMGFKSFGFGGGRVDVSAREEEVYWGTDSSYRGLAKNVSKLESTLGAVEMHLIYVNPEGPDAIANPLLAAAHIKETFSRMSMNSEETVALVAGGHTFGKCHGAVDGKHVGAAPNEAAIEQQGFGWKNKFKSGVGEYAVTSGLEGAWTENPAKWDHGYFTTLFKYEWELFKSPAGAQQWRPKKGAGKDTVPHAHIKDKMVHPIMLTTDLALREDPEFNKISKRFLENHDEFADAYARAWYKLPQRHGSSAASAGCRRGCGTAVAGPYYAVGWHPHLGQFSQSTEGGHSQSWFVADSVGECGVGFRLNVAPHGFPRRCQRGPHPAGAAEWLGCEQPNRAGGSARQAAGHLRCVQRPCWREGLNGRLDRAGRRSWSGGGCRGGREPCAS